MNRRLFASGASVAFLAACTATTPTQASANATKIVAIAQAGMSTLNAELAIFHIVPTGDAAKAYAALQTAMSGLSTVAVSDAQAIAAFATDPVHNLSKLLIDAGTALLPVFQADPATAKGADLIAQVIASAPLIVVLAQTILAPAAASMSSGSARQSAARIGVRL